MIYLDHAATAFPKAPGVVEAVARFLDNEAGNPGRGGHRLTVAASRAIEAARTEVAGLLGGDPERTLLGPGATHWLNAVLAGRLRPGDRVVTSALEHNSLMRPLRRLELERGLEIVVVAGSDPDGVPDAEAFRAAVAAAPTSLVAVNHASNVTGAVLPVAEIAAAVAPTPVLVDGAQTAGSLPLDIDRLGVAAFVCSGHKGLLGPPGVGVLLLAEGFHLEPLVLGGTGSRSESEEMPEHLPDRLEAGTPNGPGIAGLGAACRWLADRDVSAVAAHERRLIGRLADGLAGIAGVSLHGWRDGASRVGVLSFTVAGSDLGELAARLDRGHGICLRAGLHCAPAAHRRIGTFPGGTLRAGVGPFNTEADIDALFAAVRRIVDER
ncbi:MAG: aminotransferase class V-fold PLP-dependent enzyme [Thermoanaerobaculales bacterium]|nr:aminotransferase class V-fold PLP-dependent enzyme [Thermoanaerobaculales bacterium]